MKSFENRIKKLEENIRLKQNEIVVIVLTFHYSPCAEKYHMHCPYLKEENDHGDCPLYEEKYKKAKQNQHSRFISLNLPCFKEGECPLCMDEPTTPTSEGNKRNQESKRKEKK
jgi:hypothetical protein